MKEMKLSSTLPNLKISGPWEDSIRADGADYYTDKYYAFN
jgi:hypothetical protein